MVQQVLATAVVLAIAVLPSPDESPEGPAGFSEGMAEELLNALAKIPGLQVTGRVSAFQFADKKADFRTIGRKLNVATIWRSVGMRATGRKSRRG
jgi:TolB-like protein